MRIWIVGCTLVSLIAAMCMISLAQPSGQQAPPAQGGRPQKQSDRPPQTECGPFVPPLMAALDTDNDGTISADELAVASSSLKKLDRNNDGVLTPDELHPAPPLGERPAPGRPPAGDETAIVEGPPAPKDAAEEKILNVLADLDRNQRPGMMNVPVEDGRLLRLLAEASGAKHVVEIGTSNGYSGIWLCLALRTTRGSLTTYEIDPRRAALARENFGKAGVDGMVTLIEGDAHVEVVKLKKPIDLLFLDADKQGYLDYLEKLLPLIRPGGLVIAHNMSPRQADPRYVRAVTTNPALETLFLRKEGAGVGVTLKKR